MAVETQAKRAKVTMAPAMANNTVVRADDDAAWLQEQNSTMMCVCVCYLYFSRWTVAADP